MSISKITEAPTPLEEVAKINELVDGVNNSVDLTTNQSIGGRKTFTNGRVDLVTDGANAIVFQDTSATVGQSTLQGIYELIAVDGDSNRFSTIQVASLSDKSSRLQLQATNAAGNNCILYLVKKNDGTNETYAPPCTLIGSIVTTTERSVGTSSVKFGLGNGLKIATKEVQLTAATDYSWSYGITFSAAPVILVTRRSGATSTGGTYDAWIRGNAGTSSSKIYCPSAVTVELVAIGY